MIEDDTQDGPDHVDAQRTVAFVAGPCVKQGAIVSEHYTTVSMLRTIVDILGAEPMAEVFSTSTHAWDYTAIVPEILRTNDLPLPPPTEGNSLATSATTYDRPVRTAAYWAEKTADLDFKRADNLAAGRASVLKLVHHADGAPGLAGG